MTGADAIEIVKMSGAGNDFLVLEDSAAERLGDGVPDWSRRVCRRGLSIGADGVLVVTPIGTDRLRVRFYNPDGTEAFCGNGTRCAARFARLRNLAGASMILETSAGEVPAEVTGERVRLRLPAPTDAGRQTLALREGSVEGRWIMAGSPHFVTFVDAPERALLERWGPEVRRHPRFGPNGVNFDLASSDGHTVTLLTWEKGVERETLACGSGAVAAAFAARLDGAEDRLQVLPASGIPLEIVFEDRGDVWLTGDARVLFEGSCGPESTQGFRCP